MVVPDEAIKDELNRSLADAQGIASGIRFVTTQAWLDRMNHGSPDVSGRARALEWGIYAVVTDQAFLARPECSRLKKYIEDNASSALWPLVSRIAGLFSTYFSYRADWLWNWAGKSLANNNAERTAREAAVLAQHPDFAWQKALWLELCSRTKVDGTKLWPTANTFWESPRSGSSACAKLRKTSIRFTYSCRENCRLWPCRSYWLNPVAVLSIFMFRTLRRRFGSIRRSRAKTVSLGFTVTRPCVAL